MEIKGFDPRTRGKRTKKNNMEEKIKDEKG